MKARALLVAVVLAMPVAGAAAPALACAGEVCEAVNLVCEKVTKGHPCVK